MISGEAWGLGGASEVRWQGVGRRGTTTERHQEPQTGERGPLRGCWGNWVEFFIIIIMCSSLNVDDKLNV